MGSLTMKKMNRRWVFAWAWCVSTVLLAGCASGFKLPPIEVVLPTTQPSPAAPAAPVVPRATLAFHVLDVATGAPIGTAFAILEDGASKQATDEGYIAFELPAGAAVYVVRFEADGYEVVTRRFQLGTSADEPDGAGNRQFSVTLRSTAPEQPVEPPLPVPSAVPAPEPEPVPPAPAPAPAPKPPVELVECGPRANPTAGRLGCLLQVAASSPHWKQCANGSGVDCHRYVREVARALAAGDRRWGLITKNRGEMACTLDRCARDVVGGYGEDVVAYLLDGMPLDQWHGVDIVRGAGAPNALAQWSDQPLPRREGNLWAPVP
jgi:hypothetical protein